MPLITSHPPETLEANVRSTPVLWVSVRECKCVCSCIPGDSVAANKVPPFLGLSRAEDVVVARLTLVSVERER